MASWNGLVADMRLIFHGHGRYPAFMLKRLLVFLAIGVPICALAATPVIYKWIGKHGEVHYSDIPHPGATKISLGQLSVVPFKTPSANALSANAKSESRQAKQKLPHYEIKVISPANGATLRPVDYRVAAQVSISPALGPGAYLDYSLDGKPVADKTSHDRLILSHVYRGTHTLKVTVRNASGKVLGEASSTFYVHHHSILFKHPAYKPG